MNHQIIRFGIIGVSAMAVHFLAVLLITPLGINPLIANILAFIIAFQVSFFGHKHWTFHNQTKTTTSSNQQFIKFALVALTSFIINESLYYLLLKFTTLHYLIALLIILITVAIITFILSKYWAFKSQQ